jgi:hypothetical protein
MVLRRPIDFAQYTSLAFGRRLRDAGLVPSMSRPANCWDTQSMMGVALARAAA